MSTPIEYGREITLGDAERIIDEHTRLNSKINTGAKLEDIESADLDNVAEFVKRDNNAFVFSKDLIMRFFEKESDANYLLVLLGAHPDGMESPSFKAGSFTVVTAGCVGTLEESGKLKLRTLPIENAANEYPNGQVIENLESLEDIDPSNQKEFIVS